MKNVLSPLSKRFDHPLLASMFIMAGVFVVLGLATDAVGSNPFAAGFFGVYAITCAVLGLLGYGVTYAVKYVSQLRDDGVGSTGTV